MRFIRQEEIITTVCNKELTQNKSIAFLLKSLLKENVEFSLSINKDFSRDYSRRLICYDRTRVDKINNNNTVDFLVFQKSSMVSIKEIPFSDISEIFTRTKKTGLAQVSIDKNRWDFLDITEEDL